MRGKISILVVDDEPQLLRLVRSNLEVEDYQVSIATDATSALKLIELETFDLIILDIMLPKMDGFQMCQHIRQFSNIPILILTAKVEDADKVKGLRLGADDYLTKPFNIQELLARIEAILRRSNDSDNTREIAFINCGDLHVDFVQRRVMIKGLEIPLTLIEYNLLVHLVKNAGRVMLHSDLLTKVWGIEYRDEVEYLRAYIRHLRRKIEPDPHQPEYILSRPGIGYLFVNPDQR